MGCNSVAWMFGQLPGECNGVAEIYGQLAWEVLWWNMDLWQIDPLPEHRCLAYHYTKLGRSTGRYIYHIAHIPIADWSHCTPQTNIATLHNIPPNLQIYIAQCTYTYGRLTPPHHVSITYITMHIYPCQIHSTPSSNWA